MKTSRALFPSPDVPLDVVISYEEWQNPNLEEPNREVTWLIENGTFPQGRNSSRRLRLAESVIPMGNANAHRMGLFAVQDIAEHAIIVRYGSLRVETHAETITFGDGAYDLGDDIDMRLAYYI